MPNFEGKIKLDFTDAVRTILIRENQGLKRSVSAWARCAKVDPKSLKLLEHSLRPIQCAYSIQLCCGLGLSFSRVLSEAIRLRFKAADGGRYVWKCQLIHDPSAHDPMPAQDANLFSAALCSALSYHVVNSGRSFSELAKSSGVDRTVISRLCQRGRQNPSLQSLFDLSCALSCQLDVIAGNVAAEIQRSRLIAIS